jgi:hypothetical protein
VIKLASGLPLQNRRTLHTPYIWMSGTYRKGATFPDLAFFSSSMPDAMPIRDSDPEATVEPRGLDKWVLSGVRSLGPATEVTESVGAAASPTPRCAAVLPSGVMVTYRLGVSAGKADVPRPRQTCSIFFSRRHPPITQFPRS